jgi:hypothetical protein
MNEKGISFGSSRMLVGGLIPIFPMKTYLLSMGHIIRLETKIWCETGQQCEYIVTLFDLKCGHWDL